MKTIMAALDFSDVTPSVVDQAALLAKGFGSKVFFVHVMKPRSDYTTDDPGGKLLASSIKEQIAKAEKKIKAQAKPYLEKLPEAELLLPEGRPADTILEQADELDADLIIVGSHGHGALFHILVGSVTDWIMRKTSRPTLVVPSNP